MATTPPNLYSIWQSIKAFMQDRFNLDEDKASEHETIAEIDRAIIFKGTNLWILIFAIMVASVGLNVNSTAVVIGAMLISPLMGPIMGIGLGVGIYDVEMIVKSLRNLGIAVAISVLTSAFYFWISPINDASSELLGRTNPTLWDVLIALFGGLAGIVAGSRREKSNAIPGVAIATALMPPLCTAGYGLATWQWNYFFGAFYLFFINSVFISLSTYMIVRLLRFRQKEFVDPARERRIKQSIFLFVLLTIVPSVYTGYNVVRKNLYERRVQDFVREEFNFDKTKVIDFEIVDRDSVNEVDITLFGEPLLSSTIHNIEHNMLKYNIENTHLRIRQRSVDTVGIELPDFDLLNQQMRTGIIEDLYKKNEEALQSKEQRIKLLEEELVRVRAKSIPQASIANELQTINPNVIEFSISESVIAGIQDSMTYDTVWLAFAKFRKPPKRADKRQLEDWLKVRLKKDNVRLVAQ